MSTEVVRFEGVTVRRSGRTIVDAVDWTVRAGEHWAVLGPNGAGKTTLLRIASAEIHPSRGAATVLGGRFGRVSLPELRTRIGVVEPLLARALLADAPLLVLDEPAAGLDLGGRLLLLDAFDRLVRDHSELASITVMHHLEELPRTTTHALLLHEGRIVAAGPLARAITDDTLSETFGLALRVERANGRLSASVRKG